MVISDEKIEEVLTTITSMMQQMQQVTNQNSELQKANSDLHKEMIELLKAKSEITSPSQMNISPGYRPYSDQSMSDGPHKSFNRPRPTRPSIEAEMDDARWGILLDKWQHYKRIAELSEQDVCLELMESCSSHVHELLYQYVGTAELYNPRMSEEIMLKHIKSVAVKSVHKEVYRWRYGQLKQGDSEPVTKYAGRLKSEAILCDYKVKCTCGETMSFAEEMVSQQLITGLVNPEHQSRVMSEAQDLPKLQDKIDRVISLETTDDATANIRSTASRSSAVKFSKYKQDQRNRLFDRSPRDQKRGRAPMRQSSMSPRRNRNAPPRSNMSPRRKCIGCGRHSHPEGKGLSREECPAFGQTCHECGLKNHFSKVCRRRSRSNYAGTDDDYITSGSDTEVSECNYSGRENDDEQGYEEECTESRILATKAQGFRPRPRAKPRV